MSPQGSDFVTRDYLDLRLGEVEARMTDKLTWRMITILGGWTAIVASLFALLGQVVR